MAEAVREQQQRQIDQLGMWVFLVSEAMLFGVIFLALAMTLILFPAGVRTAVARLDMVEAGAMTAMLLTSSFTMTLAIRSAAEGRRRATLGSLTVTAALGTLFEAVKIHSWSGEVAQGLLPGPGPDFPIGEPGARLFFDLYFVATGLHALHLALGISVVALLAAGIAFRRQFLPLHAGTVEMAGLYWHLVDIVWIFLYPTLYLVGR